MKRFKMIALVALMLCVAALYGCANQPDTMDDPLSLYEIDEVLPFATAAPEAIAATPTPQPTPRWDVEADPPAQTWQQEQGDPADDDPGYDDPGYDDPGYDDYDEPDPTPRPNGTQTGAADYVELRKGDTGSEVRNLQNRLKSLGYYTGSVDGAYGSGTVNAVIRLQSILGYEEDGIASVSLQRALFSKNAPSYTQPASTPRPTTAAEYVALSRGDQGERVSRLQKRLSTLGYYTGTVDGDYGSGTVYAVRRFQQALGITQTGTASVSLQRTLYSSDAPVYRSQATPTPEPVYDEPDYDEPVTQQYVRLTQGSSGTRVRNLQTRLRKLGYYTGTVDGEYGAGTAAAVRLFQRTIGATENGVATASLQQRIFNSNAPIYAGDEPDTPTYTTLSPGDTGDAVKALQRRLKKLGYFDGDIGGNYLTLTTEAVKRFQRQINQRETGIATASLQMRLFASSAPVYDGDIEPEETPQYTVLSEGDSGTAVTRLQQRLFDLGYYDGTVNGRYNAKTAEAIMRFEDRYGKPQTGVATVSLQRKLFSSNVLSAYDEEPTPTPEEENYRRLEKGSSGTAVRKLQRRLRDLGYYDGEISGNYGNDLVNAVSSFQKAIGVTQTGVASVSFQTRVYASDAPIFGTNVTPEPSYKTMKRGDTGAAVGALQTRLQELGYIRNIEDVTYRTFDRATMYAVIEAQVARGYESDGVADVDFLTYVYSDRAWDDVAFGGSAGDGDEDFYYEGD